jgi:phenylacetic acid degradation operon negative regulatory protein
MSKYVRISGKRHKRIKARFATVIYTLFGAYVTPRGGEVHVGSLIELVRALGFSENAIRLGLSRMSRYGAFKVRRRGRRSYYSLSRKGMEWMELGRVRAFEVAHKKWDGKWRLVVYNIPETFRVLRGEIRTNLQSLGFASLSASVWISPHDFRSEIVNFVKERNMTACVEIFEAEYKGLLRARTFAATVWDIDGLQKSYLIFVDRYRSLRSKFERLARTSSPMDPAECFAERFCMTAEYVALRLGDPMLPLELLPAEWAGLRAHSLHDTMWDLLKPAADSFIDSVLRK